MIIVAISKGEILAHLKSQSQVNLMTKLLH